MSTPPTTAAALRPEVIAEGQGLLVDLQRELAGGREDQRAAAAGLAGVKKLQQRQQEGCGLAGAGGGAADEVAAGEHDGDGLAWIGVGFGVAHVGDGIDELGNQV